MPKKKEAGKAGWETCKEKEWMKMVRERDRKGYKTDGKATRGEKRTNLRNKAMAAIWKKYRGGESGPDKNGSTSDNASSSLSSPRTPSDGYSNVSEEGTTFETALSVYAPPYLDVSLTSDGNPKDGALDEAEATAALEGDGFKTIASAPETVEKSYEDPSDGQTVTSSKRQLTDHDGSSADEDEDIPAKKPKKSRKGLKKGEGVGVAKKPMGKTLQFRTFRYRKYGWDRSVLRGIATPGKFKGSYAVYDQMLLVDGDIPDGFRPKMLPKEGVRLSDRWVGIVAGLGMSAKELAQNYPGEFDNNGMLRARRVPLGLACYVWVKKGHKDVKGDAAPSPGLYYGWYRGLQPLFGDEAFNDYVQRPGHEKELCRGIGFMLAFPVLTGDIHDRDRADLETTKEPDAIGLGNATRLVLPEVGGDSE